MFECSAFVDFVASVRRPEPSTFVKSIVVVSAVSSSIVAHTGAYCTQRCTGPNEIIAVLLMAAKFNVPVCPHAGGVGLCEYAVVSAKRVYRVVEPLCAFCFRLVQHLSMFDYICVSARQNVVEYVDHLVS